MLRTVPFYFGNVERKLHSEYINMYFPSMEGEILAFGISLCRGYYERQFNLLGSASGSAWWHFVDKLFILFRIPLLCRLSRHI
jgi:hypothetical protein